MRLLLRFTCILCYLCARGGAENSYAHCNGIDGLERDGHEMKHSSCSPPGLNLCFQFTGFSLDDYAGNGIYCALNETVEVAEFERIPHYTMGHYIHMAKPNLLRYEIMLSSKYQTEEGGTGFRYSWMLLRVTRSLTSRKNWHGVPVYLSKTFEEGGEGRGVGKVRGQSEMGS